MTGGVCVRIAGGEGGDEEDPADDGAPGSAITPEKRSRRTRYATNADERTASLRKPVHLSDAAKPRPGVLSLTFWTAISPNATRKVAEVNPTAALATADIP